MPSRRNLALLLLFTSAALFFGGGASAQIVQRADPAPKTDPCKAEVTWDWTFTPAAAEAPAAPYDGTNWSLKPTSPAAAAGATAKALTIEVQHLIRCDRQDIVPGRQLTIQAGNYSPGVIRAGANVILHPNAPGHADIYNWLVQVPVGGPNAIRVTAAHIENSGLPRWSYKPLRGRQGGVQVFASYPSDPERPMPMVGLSGRGTPLGGDLPLSMPGRERPSDVRIVVSYNPVSDTTLAFVVRNQDGALDKADLGQLTQSFRGADEYLVPALFDEQGAGTLFVAVDLSQWLSLPRAYKLNDRFVFKDGASEDLAGFLVSAAPIQFDRERGFVTEQPYSGTLTVLGEIDGQATPLAETPTPTPEGQPTPPAEQPARRTWLIVIIVAILLAAALALLLRRRRS